MAWGRRGNSSNFGGNFCCRLVRDRGKFRVITEMVLVPLPPVVSPTIESPGYVAKSNPEEDLEEYEDDETEDGPVDYPMEGGDDRDDDDGDSSRDDADDEDEDEDEEEHLAPADSAILIPTDELVSPPEGTEPVMPPPSTDTATTRAVSSDLSRFLIELRVQVSSSSCYFISTRSDPYRFILRRRIEAILDRQDRVMRKKTIPFIKILWRNHPEQEAT
nr:hypothetical protein [Tanacetum cinerariifolium]